MCLMRYILKKTYGSNIECWEFYLNFQKGSSSCSESLISGSTSVVSFSEFFI